MLPSGQEPSEPISDLMGLGTLQQAASLDPFSRVHWSEELGQRLELEQRYSGGFPSGQKLCILQQDPSRVQVYPGGQKSSAPVRFELRQVEEGKQRSYKIRSSVSSRIMKYTLAVETPLATTM